MTNCATFEQAFSASAFTGRDVFAFGDEKEEVSRSEHPGNRSGLLAEDLLQNKMSTVTVLTRHSSTLLQHSDMFELVSGFLDNTATFSFPESGSFASPREILARIGNYISVEDSDKLAGFIARNSDIAELLEQAARYTANHPHFSCGEIAVFSEPADSDYCVYVNADFAVNSYEDVYAFENQVFSEVIEPHFDKVKFRILLSFDTDSDD